MVAGTRKDRLGYVASLVPETEANKISRPMFVMLVMKRLGLRKVTVQEYVNELIECGEIKTNHWEVWR